MRRLLLALLVLALLLAGLRAAAPEWLRARIQAGLADAGGGSARVEDVDLCLACGGYRIEGVTLERPRGEGPPLFEARRIELGLDFEKLRGGTWAGRIRLREPVFRLDGRGGGGFDLAWPELVAPLYPLPLTTLELREGALHMRSRERGFELFVRPFRLDGRNLEPVASASGPVQSTLEGHGRMMGTAPLHLELEVAGEGAEPSFRLRASLAKLPLPSINGYLESAASLDASKGRVAGDLWLQGSDERYRGGADLVVREARWLELPRDLGDGPLRLLWQGLLQASGTGQGPLHVRVPMSGSLEDTQIDAWHSVATLVRRALLAIVGSPIEVLDFLASQAEKVAP